MSSRRMPMKKILLIPLALSVLSAAPCAAHADTDGEITTTLSACRPDTLELAPKLEHRVRWRLEQGGVKLLYVCNYRDLTELFVNLKYDPKASMNLNDYDVMYHQVMDVLHKNVNFIDQNAGYTINLLLEHSTIQMDNTTIRKDQ
jgi:hypothetical protein